MLSVPPPSRIAFGTLEVAGQKVELFMSAEWARYFQSLNTQVLANVAELTASAALTALLGDGADAPDIFPSPPGPPGQTGATGPALFLLQDDGGESPMMVPPAVDGVYVPLNTKDAPGGVPGLTQLKLNLKNAAGTITSWFTTAATAARTWTMPDKDGTVAVLSDFAAPPAIGAMVPGTGAFTALTVAGATVAVLSDFAAPPSIGATVAAAGKFTTLTSTAGFGCNGKAAQAAAASGGTLAGVIAALVANGILSS
jgi:hypothetical protein